MLQRARFRPPRALYSRRRGDTNERSRTGCERQRSGWATRCPRDAPSWRLPCAFIDCCQARRGAPARALRPPPSAGHQPASGLTDRALEPLRCLRPLAGEAQEVQVVAADGDLVTVLELGVIHSFAIAEYAVETAVVQDPCPTVVAIDEGVASGHRWVVEADMRGQA